MDILINQVDGMYSVEIDDTVIRYVTDYKLMTAAQGMTEINLTLRIAADVKMIEISRTLASLEREYSKRTVPAE